MWQFLSVDAMLSNTYLSTGLIEIWLFMRTETGNELMITDYTGLYWIILTHTHFIHCKFRAIIE